MRITVNCPSLVIVMPHIGHTIYNCCHLSDYTYSNCLTCAYCLVLVPPLVGRYLLGLSSPSQLLLFLSFVPGVRIWKFWCTECQWNFICSRGGIVTRYNDCFIFADAEFLSRYVRSLIRAFMYVILSINEGMP